jgi:hypothetical protein
MIRWPRHSKRAVPWSFPTSCWFPAATRDKPSHGEVHDKETDVIYVIEGAATFVTGGTMIGGKITKPDQHAGVDARQIGNGYPALIERTDRTSHLKMLAWRQPCRGPDRDTVTTAEDWRQAVA